MAGKLLGLCTCPECAFPDAQIKTDKGGNPYRYCPDCNTQTFTRGDPLRVKNMLAKVRPGTAPAAAGEAAPAIAPAVEKPAAPAAPAAKKAPAFDLGEL